VAIDDDARVELDSTTTDVDSCRAGTGVVDKETSTEDCDWAVVDA